MAKILVRDVSFNVMLHGFRLIWQILMGLGKLNVGEIMLQNGKHHRMVDVAITHVP